MKRWQVLLKGDPWDLEDIRKNQQSASWSIVKYEEKYFLESMKFQGTEQVDELKKRALDLLEMINGSARLRIPGFRPVEIEGHTFSQIDEEGHRHHFVSLDACISARVRVEGALSVTKSDGSASHEEVEEAKRVDTTLAENDPNVGEALKLFGKKDRSWSDLYKIFEIIRDDVGGERTLLHRDYVPRKDLKRFTQTAQHPGAIGDEARHARHAADVPKNPMTLRQAESLMWALLDKWVSSKRL